MPNETPISDTPANDTSADDTSPQDSTENDSPKKDSPAAELAKLNKELEEKQAAQAKADHEIDLLKSKVADLGKAVAEIDQKVKAWEKASVSIKEQQKTQKSYFDREKRELEATLSAADQKLVKDARAKGQKEVADSDQKVADLQLKVASKKTALANAEAAKTATAQAYKAEVDLATKDSDLLKDLTTLHGDADKEEAKNNVLRQYFLILEGEDDLTRLDVPDVNAYAERLNNAGAAMAAASNVERLAKEELEKAQVELQTAQKDSGDAKKSRRQKTLASIQENGAVPVPG